MQVRVFESADMASGLKMIKQELGPDALILSTRTIRSGKLGILGKPILEITAAIDTDFPQSKKTDIGLSHRGKDRAYPADKQKNSGFRHIVDDSVEHYLNEQPSSPSPSSAAASNLIESKSPRFISGKKH